MSRQAGLARLLARCGGLWGCGADQGSDDGGFGLGACDDALGGGDLELAPSTAPGAACDAGRACGVVPWLNGGALVAGAPPSLILARPHEYPAAAAARRHLAAQSGAWRRLDLGSQPSVHECASRCGAQPSTCCRSRFRPVWTKTASTRLWCSMAMRRRRARGGAGRRVVSRAADD